ncbi:MAG: DoxX family protein [Gemmatimonadota bacterium]
MESAVQTAPLSNKRLWAGRILSALPVLFLLWDSAMKLVKPPVVVDSFARLGYPQGIAVEIGILQLVCVAFYVVPRTSVLGAILLTGYLGGAVATHVRVEDPLFSHVLFPAYMGVLLWAGLYLREVRLHPLIPLRR